MEAQAARDLTRVAQYQRARAEYVAARELIHRALAIQRAVYGLAHSDVAVTLGYLGAVHTELGELGEARIALRRALVIHEAVYGSSIPRSRSR